MKPHLTVTATGSERRAFITGVKKGAPAEAAGLKENDTILRINDREVSSAAQVTTNIWRLDDGDVIKITVWRGGEILSLNATLAIRPEDKPLAEL